jgi:hypothetical protein
MKPSLNTSIACITPDRSLPITMRFKMRTVTAYVTFGLAASWNNAK